MKQFSNKISLTRNSRGLWYIDPLLGCSHGYLNNGKGCYGVCYASRSLKCRGYNFDIPVKRHFKDELHFHLIAEKLIKIPFVRMGVNCDPSDDWNHTCEIIKKIKPYNKNIVIVTKHWNDLTEENIDSIKGLFINTSISALDSQQEIEKRLFWYNKLKKTCFSILRVNTAKFTDSKKVQLQAELLKNENTIDNILRFNGNKAESVIVEKMPFLSGKCFVSKFSSESYLGDCFSCPDLCGINMFKKCRLIKPAKQITLFELIGD